MTLSTNKNRYSKIKDSETNLIDYIGQELQILNKIIKANDKLSEQFCLDDEFYKNMKMTIEI